MKKHNLLLSLLSLLFAVLMTSCSSLFPMDSGDAGNNGSSNRPDAIITETLSIKATAISGQTYSFVPQIAGVSENGLTYLWKFGDTGATSTEPTPTYTFPTVGNYLVTLTVYNGNEVWKASSLTLNVSESGSIINPEIIATPVVSGGMEYVFTSRATAADGSTLYFNWNFGEGDPIEGNGVNSARHTFIKYNKVYTVTLVISNPANDDTKTVTLNIGTPEVTVDFGFSSDGRNVTFSPSVSRDDIQADYEFTITDSTGAVIGTTTSSSSSPNAIFTFPVGGKGPYDVTCTVTSPQLDEPITAELDSKINVSVNFRFSGIEYDNATSDRLSYTYRATGVLSGANANDEVTYKWYFKNTSNDDNNLVLDQSSTPTTGSNGESVSTITHAYPRYFTTFKAKVEAYVAGSLVGSEIFTHNFVAPTYTLYNNVSSSDPLNVTFNLSESYVLKGAIYKWTYETNGSEKLGTNTSTNRYTANGDYVATVKVQSDLLDNNGYTASTDVSINGSIINTGITCTALSSTTYGFKTYSCSTNASSVSGALEYKWSVNGTVVSTSSSFQKTFEKYGESYNIDLHLTVAGTSVSADATRYVLTMPSPTVEINGGTSAVHGITQPYSIKYKVTRDGESGYITDLTNKSIRWYFNNTNNSSYNDAESINHAFSVDEGATTNNRTVRVDVTAGNMKQGLVATGSKIVTVTKPVGNMSDIEGVDLSCNDESDYNNVKKVCTVTLRMKQNHTSTLSLFSATLTAADKSSGTKYTGQTVNFSDQGTANPTIVLDWPDRQTSVTGKTGTRSFDITVTVNNPTSTNSGVMTQTQQNVTTRNYISYVLFPKPSGPSYGGTGTRIATYSCGYSSWYSANQGRITGSAGAECNEGNSASQTKLNLGSLVGSDGRAKVPFTAKWKYRIYTNTRDFQQYDWAMKAEYSGEIKTVTFTKGQEVNDNLKVFDIATAFNNVIYTGDVYNDNQWNNIFALEISGESLSKPLEVSYNGNPFQDKGNRLTILAPLSKDGDSNNKCTIQRTINPGSNIVIKHIDTTRYFGSGYFDRMKGNVIITRPTYYYNANYTQSGKNKTSLTATSEDFVLDSTNSQMYESKDNQDYINMTNIGDYTLNYITQDLYLKNMLTGSKSRGYQYVYKTLTCVIK